jgi:hypothetical protein
LQLDELGWGNLVAEEGSGWQFALPVAKDGVVVWDRLSLLPWPRRTVGK